MPKFNDITQSIATLLKQRNETIAVVESSAGGLISASLLSVPGASSCFIGGIVSYTGVSRGILLGITDQDLVTMGMRASTESYAQLLAGVIREKFGTTWGICETGASGPTGNRYGDSAGHVCLAISGPVDTVATYETAQGDREANMWAFAAKGLEMLEECLKE